MQDDKYEIPEEDLIEIKRRAKEMEENPELGLTWDEVRKGIKKRMKERAKKGK